MTHLSLFTGIGGLDLAAEAAGFRTVGQCEWADYPTKVLEKHWPEVPRWRDIRTLTKEGFYERTGLRTAHIISGGFPCQPFSTAGKRRGSEDDRYLWPEMLRVIKELQPAWIIGENVAGIINMALDTVLSDLEAIGYTCRTLVIPACSVNAPHRRDRCAIVAHADADREDIPGEGRTLHDIERFNQEEKQGRNIIKHGTERNSEDVAHADSPNGERAILLEIQARKPEPPDSSSHDRMGRRATQPDMGRGDDGLSSWLDGVRAGWTDGTWEAGIPRIAVGVPDRVSRLKCLGNAVVPAQFYPVFKAIYDIEERRNDP